MWRLFERFTNGALRADYDRLDGKLQQLRSDHYELMERFVRLQGRLAKRGELTPPAAEQSPPGEVPAAAAPLTGSAADLQERILARRRGRVSA